MARRKAKRGRQRAVPRFTRTQLSVATWLLQSVIAVIGLIGLFDQTLVFLLVWCALATVFSIVVVASLAVQARRDDGVRVEPAQPPVWLLRIRGYVVALLTAAPTLIGLSLAVGVIVFGRVGEVGTLVKLVGVWGMLLAWGYLHWGFAQLYEYRAQRALPTVVFQFPDTPSPTLVDYVYFSFTVGTSFAASDVTVLTTRMRWTVTVHSVIGFFINALIIVLSFNTIIALGESIGDLIPAAG